MSSAPNAARVALRGTAVATLLALALAVRLVPIVTSPEVRRNGLGIFGDSPLYVTLGLQLALGRGFTAPRGLGLPPEPVATRGPAYPFFVSIVFRALQWRDPNALRFGSERRAFDAVRIAQATLDATACLAAFGMARVLWPSSYGPALVAALLAALCPYTVYYTRALLKETLATTLLSWTMLAAVAASRDTRRGWGILAGIGSGLLALCTPQFLPLAPLLAVATILAARGSRRVAALVAAYMLVAWVAVVAPWTYRNWVVFERFIPVSTGDLGYGLYVGTFESNTNWTGWNEFPDEIFANAGERDAVLAARDRFLAATQVGSIRATETDAFFKAKALERWRNDPLGCLALGIARLPRLWFQWYIPMYADREASGVFFLVYFALALHALVATSADVRRRMLPIVLLFLFENAVYLPLHVEPRQAVPLYPSLLSLSAIGLWHLVTVVLRPKSAVATTQAGARNGRTRAVASPSPGSRGGRT